MLHPETLKILILWGFFPIRLNATNISFLDYTNILKALKLGCYERESVQTPPGNAAMFHVPEIGFSHVWRIFTFSGRGKGYTADSICVTPIIQIIRPP